MCCQCVNHCADIAVNKAIQIIAGHVNAMIGNTTLGEIIGADAFGAIALPTWFLRVCACSAFCFCTMASKRPGPQNFHCLDFIFQL